MDKMIVPPGYNMEKSRTGQAQAVFGFDLERKLVHADAFGLQLFGLTDGDVVRDVFLEQLVHPEDAQRLLRHCTLTLEGRDFFEQEYRAQRRDGLFFPVKVSTRRTFNQSGLVGVFVSIQDLTASKKADVVFWENDACYRTFFDRLGTSIIVFGSDSIIRSCNPQFEELSGYPRGEIEGKMHWFDFISPEDVRRIEIYHSMRLEECCYAPKEYDFVFLGREEGRKNIHITVEVIPGTELRICSLTDITSRVSAEEAQRKSSERYELVLRGANDGIWDYDLITGAFYLSSDVKAALGYEDREFPDQVVAWKQYTYPDDYERIITIMRDNIASRASAFQVEFRMRHKDGSLRWVRSRGTIIRDAQGNARRLVGTHSDITERKQHERTTNALYAISKAITTTRDLQHLYENIHDILGQYIDAKNFFIGVVDELEDRLVFPYFMDENDACYDIRDIQSTKTRSLTVHVIRTGKPLFFSKGDPVWQNVLDEVGVVGTPPAVWLGVPLKFKERIVGAMAVQHYSNPHHYTEADVAFMEAVSEQVALAIERKANQEELTRLNEELENKVEARTAELRDKAAQLEAANRRLTELDEIKSALVSSISHELRTPLTSIRGFAKLTHKDFLRHFYPFASHRTLQEKGERIRKNLEIIESEGQRLTRLISDFLDINRIESGNAVWSDSRLDPCRVIRQAVSALSGAFALKEGVELVVDIPDVLPHMYVDSDKLQQVLINLLHNAYKFTAAGTVQVCATACPESVTVTVADTGTGIPADEQEHIFEKFHKSRTGDTVDSRDKGTGLGLAICREIIQHYGGTIWVESSPGAGSSFSFTLPVLSGPGIHCAE